MIRNWPLVMVTSQQEWLCTALTLYSLSVYNRNLAKSLLLLIPNQRLTLWRLLLPYGYSYSILCQAHRMLYSCNHMATVGVKGLTATFIQTPALQTFFKIYNISFLRRVIVELWSGRCVTPLNIAHSRFYATDRLDHRKHHTHAYQTWQRRTL